jgi:hypothetical protein
LKSCAVSPKTLKRTASEERKDLFAQMQALRDGALTNEQVNASIAQALEDWNIIAGSNQHSD